MLRAASSVLRAAGSVSSKQVTGNGVQTHHLGHTKNNDVGVLCEGDLIEMETQVG